MLKQWAETYRVNLKEVHLDFLFLNLHKHRMKEVWFDSGARGKRLSEGFQ